MKTNSQNVNAITIMTRNRTLERSELSVATRRGEPVYEVQGQYGGTLDLTPNLNVALNALHKSNHGRIFRINTITGFKNQVSPSRNNSVI